MDNVLKSKSEDFALRIIKMYKYLTNREQNREYIMSRQLLRSGTSIGANVAEVEFAISRDDFKAKLYVSLKECNESSYWIRLLYKSGYLSDVEYESLLSDCQELLRLLVSITKTLKEQKANGSIVNC